jgi:hypothetical protein
MPKQIYKLDKFDGGINNVADPRDIADNQLVQATDIAVDARGRIRLQGTFVSHEANTAGYLNSNTAHGSAPGTLSGLFSYGTDYTILHTDGGLLDDAGQNRANYLGLYHNEQGTGVEEYTVFMKTKAGVFDWLKNDEEIAIDGGTGGEGRNCVPFFNIHGNIRVACGGGTNYATWIGVLPPAQLGPVDTGTTYAGIFRSGSSTDNLPYSSTGGPVPCFPEHDNGDGDSVARNAIMGNTVLSDGGGGAAGVRVYGFANESCETGGTPDTTGVAATNIYWGAALEYGEGDDLSGTWMPTQTTRYKFWITTVYDDGTQESTPQLFCMYNSNQLLAGAGANDYSASTAKSEFYFTDGGTIANAGEMVAAYFMPVVKITAAATGDAGSAASEYFNFGAAAHSTVTDTGDRRISGIRYYWSSSEDGYSDLWRIFDCDFEKGVKAYGMGKAGDSGSTGYAPWVAHRQYSSDNYHYMKPDFTTFHENNIWPNPPKILSYYTANQHEPFDNIVLNKFRTAVFANDRVYAGNVNQDRQYSDRIMKSIPGQYDKFPSENFLEAAPNDGDEIIHLATYNDRLLQFNENVLYIINIAQEREYVEATYKFKGITLGAQVCTTDVGIAWGNAHGAYFYDGNKVIDLTEKRGEKVLQFDDPSFSPLSVGYIQHKRQLYFHTATVCYIYDIPTRSWVHGSNAMHSLDALPSNFVNDYNGDLVYYGYDNEEMFKWDSTSVASSKVLMVTKDFDFGAPGIRKKIYKVYLTFKGNGTHVQIHYGTNGLAPALTFFPITSGTDGSSTGTGATAKCIPYNADTTDWLKAELKPGASVNNKDSFQLKISGDGSNTIATDFEINDISIVYRMKGIK